MVRGVLTGMPVGIGKMIADIAGDTLEICVAVAEAITIAIIVAVAGEDRSSSRGNKCCPGKDSC